jgi:hypothetical protein
MPVSLRGAKESSGYNEPLRGKVLKDHLVSESIPIMVTSCEEKEGEYGEYWEISITFPSERGQEAGVLNFATHPDRDEVMQILATSSEQDSVGPLLLRRKGTKGWLEFEDADTEQWNQE